MVRMPNKFVHIGCMFQLIPKTQQLDATFNAVGDDWIRYAANNWIVWTPRSVTDWYTLVKPNLDAEDMLLIAVMNLHERYGWLPQWVWEWMEKRLKNDATSVADILALLYPTLQPPSLSGNPLLPNLGGDNGGKKP